MTSSESAQWAAKFLLNSQKPAQNVLKPASRASPPSPFSVIKEPLPRRHIRKPAVLVEYRCSIPDHAWVECFAVRRIRLEL